MPAIRQMVEELESLRTQATTILDENKDGLTAEQRKTFDELLIKANVQQQAIADARADEERKASLTSLTTFLDKPEHKLPKGVGNGDEDSRKSLLAAGWEVKNGIVLAPTSLGRTVEMFGEDVLFADIPTQDADAANFFKITRAAFQPGYRTAYMNYFRMAAKMRSEGMAFSALAPEEQKALSEGMDQSGGFLVPPDVQAEMLVRLPQLAVMRRYARVQTTSRDVLKWPMVQAHSTSGSIYSSGFVGSWAGETPAFTDTDPAFGTFDIAIKKLRVATKLSNDFVADAAVNVLAFLAQNGAENMALVEDRGFIAGLGTALEPTGVLNGGVSTVDVEGSSSNTISNTISAIGTASKLIDLVYTLPSQYANNARWLMCRAIEGKIRKLVDAQARYLWPLTAGGGFAATPRELMGYPVENSEFVPNDGTDGNKVLVFGDQSAYVVAQRAQITTTVLRERFADTDQLGIVMFERVGGAVWNPDALRVGIV